MLKHVWLRYYHYNKKLQNIVLKETIIWNDFTYTFITNISNIVTCEYDDMGLNYTEYSRALWCMLRIT